MSDKVLFQDVVRKRRSVRKFEPGRSISRDVLQRIVDCGRWAPSGANVQCWDFVVVDDPAVRDRGYGRLSEAGAAARRRCERFSRGQEDLIWPTPLRFVLGDPRWKAC